MKAYIAGIQGISTVDWPGRVCSVIFFAGCNLRCRYCFNSPILRFRKKFLVDLERAKKEIEENLPLLDGILFSGGEPTLQRETLIELASWAKKKGLLVGVETNGTKPEVLRELISKNLIDFIALDIKCELSGERYKEVTGFDEEVVSQVKQSIELIKRSRVEHEFRTTLVPSLVTLKDVKQISLKLRQGKYILQRFRYDRGKLVDQSLVGKDFSKEEIKEIIALAKARVNITARSWR